MRLDPDLCPRCGNTYPDGQPCDDCRPLMTAAEFARGMAELARLYRVAFASLAERLNRAFEPLRPLGEALQKAASDQAARERRLAAADELLPQAAWPSLDWPVSRAPGAIWARHPELRKGDRVTIRLPGRSDGIGAVILDVHEGEHGETTYDLGPGDGNTQ